MYESGENYLETILRLREKIDEDTRGNCSGGSVQLRSEKNE